MKKYNKELSVGLFVLIGLLAIAYMSVKLGNVTLFSDDFYTLRANFTRITGLKLNAPVQMYGVEVGYVSRISLDLAGEQTNHVPVAVVEMKIHKRYKLDNECAASIRTNGLIGDKFLDIALGAGDDTLKDGDLIYETTPAIDLEDLINKFAAGK
ncbi:MAG: outer membrane lipid asymmetry maintenance protein MlaD [Desulfovibrionaceae bacterium]